MCLDTMSASNKLLGKTNLFSLRFGDVWNNTSSILTNLFDLFFNKLVVKESAFCALRIASIEIVPGVKNFVVFAKSW